MCLPKHKYIKELIRNREQIRTKKAIATREDRQAFWTKTMQGKGKPAPTMTDRLKASELLGRSEADFIDRSRFENSDGEPVTFNIMIGSAQKNAMQL